MTVQRLSGAPAGLYVHIPFCDRLCPYCDFAVVVRPATSHNSYVDSLLVELTSRASEAEGRDLRTVYLGGGTPTTLSDRDLERVIQAALALAPQAREVTLEVNPNHVTRTRLERWRDVGVTRVNLGVQSFQARYLQALGRNHTFDVARTSLALALDMFEHVTMDLIVGGPGHTLDELEADLEIVAALGLRHLSVYELTIEPNTVFGRRARQGSLRAADDDATADMLEVVAHRLNGLGLRKYEVSNYAALGHESWHNRNYWAGGEYLGVGLGAHSMRIEDGFVWRRANERNLKRYQHDPFAPSEVERLSARDHLIERVFVGLRCVDGISARELASQGLLNDPTSFEKMVDRAVALGLVKRDATHVKPTPKGLMMINSLAELAAEL